MLIPVSQLRFLWGVKPSGVLHVGAHDGEELSAYENAGWTPVVWVEALPDKAAALQAKLSSRQNHAVLSAVVWDVDGHTMEMKRTNNGQSSSVFAMGIHQTEHPDITVVSRLSLESSRLDTLLSKIDHRFNYLSLDIQGAELHALRGLGNRMDGVRWIYTEINTKPVYVGAPLVSELDSYLAGYGFMRVDTVMTNHGWGDALYVHRDTLPRFVSTRRFARRLLARLGRSRAAQSLMRT